MADDKHDGDDLFEDLDKFFAPIKDVDWDEPAPPPGFLAAAWEYAEAASIPRLMVIRARLVT